MPNSYQVRKAAKIANFLRDSADRTMEATSPHTLARCVALMSHDEWRTVAFQAGVPLADLQCKAAVLGLLRAKAPHAVGRTA